MKVYAYYDMEGNIQSLIRVDAAEGAFAMRAPKPNQFVAEIETEGLELTSDASDPAVLLELVERYKVTTPFPRLQLSRKTE